MHGGVFVSAALTPRPPRTSCICSWALAALALFFGILAGGAPAFAQTDVGATLVSVTLADSTPDETRLILNFSGNVPQQAVANNNSGRAAIVFNRLSRAPGANSPTFSNGPVKEVLFERRGVDLVLVVVGRVPIHLEVTSMGGLALRGSRSLLVSARNAASAGPQTSAQPVMTSSGDLPAYRDPSPTDDTFVVVPLKYADVSEIVGLLSSGQPQKPNDTFTPQEPAFGSSGITNGGSVALQQNLAAQNQDTPSFGTQVDDTIGIDRRLNAIVLRGPADRVRRLRARIAELDVPVPSVLLETVFVELTETGARNVGLDFKNASGKVGLVTFNSGSFASNTGGGASQTSAALQAAIYAQVERGEGRILSKPRIAAQSGSSAKIITGDALPILTSIALSGVNAVSQQVQYVNVGVTLQIAPRVSDDGYVTSHIFCVVSSVTGFSQGYPTISQREASTTATVLDGQFFVIGGLTQENKLTTKEQIPMLGGVPVLGELFKLHLSSSSKTQLYIVVTPHITQPGDSDAARALSVK